MGGNSGLLHGFKEGEQAGRLLAWRVFVRLRSGQAAQAFSLQLEIRFDVVVGGFRRGMPEVQGDDLDGDAGLEQRHGATIPETVRGDPPAVE